MSLEGGAGAEAGATYDGIYLWISNPRGFDTGAAAAMQAAVDIGRDCTFW